jgi:hypothetical protein
MMRGFRHLCIAALAFSLLSVDETLALNVECGKDGLECNNLPDESDPAVRRHFRCGSCQLAVYELASTIIRRRSEDTGSKYCDDADAEAMDEFCRSGITKFGLQLDERAQPLPRFTADETLNRATGGWVTRGIQATCYEVLGEVATSLPHHACPQDAHMQ